MIRVATQGALYRHSRHECPAAGSRRQSLYSCGSPASHTRNDTAYQVITSPIDSKLRRLSHRRLEGSLPQIKCCRKSALLTITYAATSTTISGGRAVDKFRNSKMRNAVASAKSNP